MAALRQYQSGSDEREGRQNTRIWVASILIGVRKTPTQAVLATGTAQVVPWDVGEECPPGGMPGWPPAGPAGPDGKAHDGSYEGTPPRDPALPARQPIQRPGS